MRARLMLLPLAAVLACGGGSDNGTRPGPGPGGGGGGGPVVTTSVDMKGNAFAPPSIRVAPGATVNFTNSDGYNHNATFSAAGISSTGNYATGSRAVAMPATPGTYAYTCTLHPGMSGSVQVQ